MAIFGLPRNFAITILIMSLTMIMALGQIWFAFVTAILLIAGGFMGRRDPYFFDIYLAAVKLPEVAD